MNKNNSRSKTKRIVGWVFTGVGIAVVLFLFFTVTVLAVDKFVHKAPVPSFFGTSALVVTTGSMKGFINEGDLVIIQKADEYKYGEVITYMPSDGSTPVTHRIVGIEGDKFVTQGDANNAEDPRRVEKSMIVGKVVNVVPRVGLFFRWIIRENGWLYAIGIIAVIVVGVVLLKLFPNGKKEN